MRNNSTKPSADPDPSSWRSRWPFGRKWAVAYVAIALFAVAGIVIEQRVDDRASRDASKEQKTASAGLPDSPDYHSLIVAPDDPRRIFLGTHIGLFESVDAGATWRQTGAIEGDAMNLARDAIKPDVMYAAGHELFQKSIDGGATWRDIPLDDSISQANPATGDKVVDIHGFATDPKDADTLYAAVAGKGLFKSTDAGESFARLSETGAAGFGVALTSTPRSIYLADTQQGLLRSSDEGKTWTRLQGGVASVAIAPDDDRRVLAAGKAIYVSIDGAAFTAVHEQSGEGYGPITFAPSDPDIAYAIGYDKTLYVSSDGGLTWTTR